MQNWSLSLLFFSFKCGFNVLEWHLIKPNLNFLCNVEIPTSSDLASDLKVDLLFSGIVAILESSSSAFLRPHRPVLLLDTSTSSPSAICSLAVFQIF
ncbi:hypothetical protein SEVIR_8G187588v4 [Setaria viridis]